MHSEWQMHRRGTSSATRSVVQRQQQQAMVQGRRQVIRSTKSYVDHDSQSANPLVPFQPSRTPGLHDIGRITCGSMTKAIDFFKLFFTIEILNEICVHTNAYAWINILNKSSYANSDGTWNEMDVQELRRLIGLLVYFGLIMIL